MANDGNGLEILPRSECFDLLATRRVGRVGVSLAALPVVLPVNFAVLDETIVIRSGPGTKLDAALSGAVVAFEADSIDDETESGWSVLIQGVAMVITDEAELRRAQAVELRPWAGHELDHFIGISADIVSGRRLHPAGVSDGQELAASLRGSA